MMTSSNGNIFRVTGHLWGEFTGHRWIPLTKASDAKLWCFLWSQSWAGDLRCHRALYDFSVMCWRVRLLTLITSDDVCINHSRRRPWSMTSMANYISIDMASLLKKYNWKVVFWNTIVFWPWVKYHLMLLASMIIQFAIKTVATCCSRMIYENCDVFRAAWWCHQTETFFALLALCAGNSQVTGEFPAQRPVSRSFGVFFDLRLNKRLSKQSWGWWFDTLSHPLWRHCNGKPISMCIVYK